MEAPATKEGAGTVLLYGHMDKQPPLTDDWEPDLGPYKPVIRDGKLYGRGGADDGYAIFSCVTAIKGLKEQNVPHGRMVIIIEGCEESGSRDLPIYVDHLKDRIGTPSLVVCLDSGCGTYDQFWLTSSLRGIVVGELRVDILTEGIHSGYASGIAPDSFRILRDTLDKIENKETGEIICPGCEEGIPEESRKMAEEAAEALGDTVWNVMPFVKGAGPLQTRSNADHLLSKTWRAALSITGIEGLPTLESAGNVLRPYTTATLSMRLPPNVDNKKASAALKEALEADPPYNAKVTFKINKAATGWMAPPLAPWLKDTINNASKTFYDGKPFLVIGEGGSIPFMGMLHSKFPDAQFVIAGVLGPNSNAHGPNEFMHIQMSANVTKCVAFVLSEHANQ
mmetsp:Transcript_7430/g.11189  ORF Transcript_7430/g.11189 Transcript_7430/m.11189 type:complete len:395 (+) Transcript_7430:159-1343(+)